MVAVSIIFLVFVFSFAILFLTGDGYRSCINDELHYIVTKGNVLLIFVSDEEGNALGTISNNTFNWWKQKVVENQDMNIITLTHQPLYDTVGGSKLRIGYIEDSERFVDVLKDYDVCLWMSGHVHHNHDGADSIVEKWGTIFIDSGSIQIQDPSQRSESRLLEFKVGSREVTVKSRDHGSGTWNADLEYSFNLIYPFQMENIRKRDYQNKTTFSIWVFSDI